VKHFKIYPDQTTIYFSTCTIIQWLCIFKEEKCFQIVIDSLKYCVENKGLFVIGYVIMLNHLHLLTSNIENTNLSNIMRDFKHFTFAPWEGIPRAIAFIILVPSWLCGIPE